MNLLNPATKRMVNSRNGTRIYLRLSVHPRLAHTPDMIKRHNPTPVGLWIMPFYYTHEWCQCLGPKRNNILLFLSPHPIRGATRESRISLRSLRFPSPHSIRSVTFDISKKWGFDRFPSPHPIRSVTLYHTTYASCSLQGMLAVFLFLLIFPLQKLQISQEPISLPLVALPLA